MSTTVFVIEHREPPGDAVTAFIGSTREKAEQFMKDNFDYGGESHWWWSMEEVALDVDIVREPTHIWNFRKDGTPHPDDEPLF